MRPADAYSYLLIASPAGPYFPRGVQPVSVWLSTEYTRAAPGGTGEAKCAGNYAASLAAQAQAAEQGCDQVVWLDATNHSYVEEMGGMNLCFVYGSGEHARIMTPKLTGTLLPGVTRDSLLTLARDLGYGSEEGLLSTDDWQAGNASGEITEVFACGTAAVITPVGQVKSAQAEWTIGDGSPGPVTMRLRQALLDLQTGAGRRPARLDAPAELTRHRWTIDRLIGELQHARRAAGRLAPGTPTCSAPVPSCPGWTVAGRARPHRHRVHRRATWIRARAATRPTSATSRPEPAMLLAEFSAGAAELADALRQAPENLAVADVVAVPVTRGYSGPAGRRTRPPSTRIDVQLAAGYGVAELDPDFAADGMDELVMHMAAAQFAGPRWTGPDTIALTPLDANVSWTVRLGAGCGQRDRWPTTGPTSTSSAWLRRSTAGCGTGRVT